MKERKKEREQMACCCWSCLLKRSCLPSCKCVFACTSFGGKTNEPPPICTLSFFFREQRNVQHMTQSACFPSFAALPFPLWKFRDCNFWAFHKIFCSFVPRPEVKPLPCFPFILLIYWDTTCPGYSAMLAPILNMVCTHWVLVLPKTRLNLRSCY